MGVLPKMFKLWPWFDLDPIYPKVKSGHVGFCIGKSEFFFFWNYCSLRSQSCLKHLAKWVNEVEWVSKVKVILWPWSKNLFFSKTVGRFGTKVHMKAWRRIGMKKYTNELGHMTNMAAMLIYAKNLKKSSSPKAIDRCPWNIVCSIVYGSTAKDVQIIILVWPWPNLPQSQIWSRRLLYGKKCKKIFFWKLLQP